MPSYSLSVAEEILREKTNCSDTDIPAVLDFLSQHKNGMWIYAGTLTRRFALDLPDAYMLLSSLEKAGVVCSYYELYCSHCHKSAGMVALFSELPETFQCGSCHSTLPALENAVLVYKVIRND